MADKEKIREMHRNGMTCRQIAKEVGYTFQYVAIICSGMYAAKHYNIRLNEKVIYPNIRRWLFENKISMSKLSVMMGYEEHTYIAEKLYGKRELKMRDIRKILEVTGMPFEVAFEEEEK